MALLTRLLNVVTSAIFKNHNPQKRSTAFQIAEMRMHRYSAGWLFERHSNEEIRRWVYDLEYGYYHRAVGGHANDCDYFSITFAYKSKQDFLSTMFKLGIQLNKIGRTIHHRYLEYLTLLTNGIN